VPIPAEALQSKVSWARDVAARNKFSAAHFQDPIDLQGNNLSKLFERATAFAKAYRLERFSETEFWEDTRNLCQLLVWLYEEERLGKAPLSDQPEIRSGQDEIEQVISGRTNGQVGQGRNLSAAERSAIEERAMVLAREALEREGFEEIRDVHKNESCDYRAAKSGSLWAIEVKDTTSKFVDYFLLTAAELKLHRENLGQTALVLVYDIELVRTQEGVSARGGQAQMHVPWSVEDWVFEPTAYRAKRISLVPMG
jgi:hypothetical protein